MIRFLLKRPIAVIMTTIAFLVLGIVASFRLPVSLMPDIDIPEISIYYSIDNASAREIENSITSGLRSRLQQTTNLKGIQTESNDGNGKISMKFEYGTSIDYAFMSVNEKVDAAMNSLPREMKRPVVVKASASDIPVFYINLRLKEEASQEKFLEFCEFSESVLRKRLEQLPDVAMVDMSGMLEPELYVLPDESKLKSLKITQEQLKNAIKNNNKVAGSLSIRDGYYHYSIRFTSQLLTKEDVANVYLNINGRLLQLKDVARVGIRPRDTRGVFLNGNRQSLCMAVIKQSQARMSDMKDKVTGMIDRFEKEYPEIEFSVSRDQALLLDYSIDNLKQSLILGILLAIFVMLFFLKDGRSPVIIAISIPASVVISMLFFRFVGISINTISLSGLIMGVGMMIDNSIIVIDNINQYRDRGYGLFESCARGTNEIIRPLISSVLTTCAVFVPLIFLSGIAGALFYDQAVAVSVGLFVSLIVSITIVPVIFNILFYKSKEGRIGRFIKRLSLKNPERYYTVVYDYLFKYRRRFILGCLLLILVGALVALNIDVERMPQLEITESIIKTDWNSSIHVDENRKRIEDIINKFSGEAIELNCHVGEKLFLLDKDKDQNTNQAELYLKANSSEELQSLNNRIYSYIAENYPEARVEIKKVDNLFEQMFKEDEAPLVVYLSGINRNATADIKKVNEFIDKTNDAIPGLGMSRPSSVERIVVNLLPDMLSLYEVSQANLIYTLEKSISKSDISILKTGSKYIPIAITGEEKTIHDIINTVTVANEKGKNIPVSALTALSNDYDFKTITGRKEGVVTPVNVYNTGDSTDMVLSRLKGIANDMQLNIGFGGRFFSGSQTLWEMLMILLIAILMLYFILAAQFESLSLPFIVLLEIPIDVAGAITILWLCGGTLNLMAMIGLIVMSGIIINDSILKIDTINRLMAEGFSLTDAIHEGGTRRLKPILMTSLTTIFAMVPFLWGDDLGTQLQQPLAIAMISGMFIGTLVSLFFIPLCYYYLMRRK